MRTVGVRNFNAPPPPFLLLWVPSLHGTNATAGSLRPTTLRQKSTGTRSLWWAGWFVQPGDTQRQDGGSFGAVATGVGAEGLWVLGLYENLQAAHQLSSPRVVSAETTTHSMSLLSLQLDYTHAHMPNHSFFG